MYIFDIPHFYIIWKIFKNPIVGRPIVAGYNWIVTPASIFVGHYLKEFYSKLEYILTYTAYTSSEYWKYQNLIKSGCFLLPVYFSSLYTNISIKDAMELMKRLFFRYQNMIPNALLILELMKIVLKGAIIKFQEEFLCE